MKSIVLMLMTFVVLALGVSMAGLDAQSIIPEIPQPTATDEGDNAFELRLQFNGEWVPCVDIFREDRNYCLTLPPAWPLSKLQGFKFYLNNRIVYNCSSSGTCSDYGVLFKNTVSKLASEVCEGIPFADIKEDQIGKYTAISEDHEEKLLTASVNLKLCKSMKLILRFKGQAAECVSPDNHDSFCLSIETDGQNFTNKAFRCFLRDRLIYKCSADGKCTGHGNLQGNVWRDSATRDCYGIPFINVVPEATGKYSCIVKDDTFLIQAGFDLYSCNETNDLELHLRKNDVEVKCIDNQDTDTNAYCLSTGSDKLQPYKEYNFTLDGSPVYSCDSSHSCSDKGILQERLGENKKFIMAEGASGNCSGLLFTTVDDTILGNYTVYAKTQSGSVVTDSYMVEFCQDSPPSSKETREETKATGDCRWISFVSSVITAITAIAVFGGFAIAFYTIRWQTSRSYSQEENDRDHAVELLPYFEKARCYKPKEKIAQ